MIQKCPSPFYMRVYSLQCRPVDCEHRISHCRPTMSRKIWHRKDTYRAMDHAVMIWIDHLPCVWLAGTVVDDSSPTGSWWPSPSRSSCSCTSSWPFPNSRYFLRLFFTLLAFFFRARSALIAARLWSPFSNCSTLSARSCRAIFSFWERERVACDFTTRPVGLWMSWTAELVLFYRLRLANANLKETLSQCVQSSDLQGQCPWDMIWSDRHREVSTEAVMAYW